MAKKTRRFFTDEEKAEVVRVVEADSGAVAEIAKHLGISASNIYNWLRASKKRGAMRAPKAAKAVKAAPAEPMTNNEKILSAIDAEIERRQKELDTLWATRKLLMSGS